MIKTLSLLLSVCCCLPALEADKAPASAQPTTTTFTTVRETATAQATSQRPIKKVAAIKQPQKALTPSKWSKADRIARVDYRRKMAEQRDARLLKRLRRKHEPFPTGEVTVAVKEKVIPELQPRKIVKKPVPALATALATKTSTKAKLGTKKLARKPAIE